jgi:hypothetical protein
MPYACPICSYCGESLGRADGRADKDTPRRREEHLRFECLKYKRILKKQNQRNLQPLPPARIIGQGGLPSLGKKETLDS